MKIMRKREQKRRPAKKTLPDQRSEIIRDGKDLSRLCPTRKKLAPMALGPHGHAI